MIRIRKAAERGHFDHGWLETYHSFSFGRYRDPAHMGFRSLRVLNEDWVQPGRGFPMHPHSDMEIVTHVLEGALEHKDTLGNGSVIRPGEIQRMSAGTGIRHSEFNPSREEPVHLLQIWLLPSRNSLRPSYEQRTLPLAERQGRLRVIASPDGRGGSVRIHQSAWIFNGMLAEGETVTYEPKVGRHVWLQVARGAVRVGDAVLLQEGDGAAVSGERRLVLQAREGAELLLFDLA